MRLGIGATSGIRPKLRRIRFRPVKDLVIAFIPHPSATGTQAPSLPWSAARLALPGSPAQTFAANRQIGPFGPDPATADRPVAERQKASRTPIAAETARFPPFGAPLPRPARTRSAM